MKFKPPIDLTDVTRLTRGGRIGDATALLKSLVGRGHDLGASPTVAQAAKGAARRFAEAAARYTPGFDAADVTAKRGSAAERTARAPSHSGTFETRTVRNAAGALTYKLYVPSAPLRGPVPLVVMLHGCTQSADDFAAGTRMNEWGERFGFLVAYPEQSKAANSSRCWNWFKGGEQSRDHGEPSLIADATRAIMTDFPIDPARVYVAGLSAGGAAAAIMGCAYPDLYAGVGVHSGLACGAASDMGSAFAAMRGHTRNARPKSHVPTIVIHGTADRTVAPSNAREVAEQVASGAGPTETEQGTKGGTTFTRILRRDEKGRVTTEQWMIDGAGHAWSGGSPAGSYAEPSGPDASEAMLRFFGIVPR